MTSAESPASVDRLAREQAALRRVATLVARESSPDEVFGAVTEEAARILRTGAVGMLRFEADETATLVAQSETPWDPPPLGTRFALDGENVVTRVFRTGEAARADDWTNATGPVAAMADVLGVRSCVATPIVVEGRIWGTLLAATAQSDPLPPNTESRVREFTELAATAIANAEARSQLARLADEQAALRRVAELVARGVTPERVFHAVAIEVSVLFGSDLGEVIRFEDDETVTVFGPSEGPDATGKRATPDPGYGVHQVRETGRSARFDTDDLSAAEIGPFVRSLGIRSAVASPVVVEGELWGAITAVSLDRPLAPGVEHRLNEFTALVAAAVANTQAREQLTALADEQAALRRVATLVAEESSLADVLAGVAEELAMVLGDVEWALARDDGDGMATVLAVSDHHPTPAGTRVVIGAGSAFGRAITEGRSARIDDYFAQTGDIARIARQHGVHAAVSCPIVVRGRTWGAMSVGWRHPHPLPPETETVVARFSDLVATAIANAEARAQVERLAAEQAALRRVATLVAEGVPSGELFSGVTTEVAHVFSDVDPALVASVIRFDPGPESVLVGASREYEHAPLGVRWAPKDYLYASTRVLRTERSARVDKAELDIKGGPDADVLRRRGFLYQVGSPIIVEGSLWGAMCLDSKEELPPDTEQRLEKFTDLVATAIANAESRAARAVLTEEQAALRRVATLVAENPESEGLFSAVAREVASVLDVRGVIVDRFEADGSQVTLGSAYDRELAGADAFLGVGVQLPPYPGTLAAAVFETHRAARVEDYSKLEGMMGDAARAAGVGSGCAAPIMVDGRLWGQMCVFSAQGTMLPPGTEHQLDDFVKLVATAISNYDARARLRMVADEQAALRRVATLVARGDAPEGVFRAVAAEVDALFGGDVSAIVRFEADGTATVLGDVGGPHEAGARVTLDPGYVVHTVRETGRSARFDTEDPSSADATSLVRTFRVRSAVASPIVVQGALWGAITAATQGAPLAPTAEQRLTEFTELVATAVANTQARNEVTTLAEEQAALRRVATLVAQGVPAPEVFSAVSDEVARLFRATMAAVGRFDPAEPAIVIVGAAEELRARIAIGSRFELDDAMIATQVHRTGRSARAGSPEGASATPPASEFLGLIRRVSSVASPIVVDGHLWGVMAVTSESDVLPPDAQERLEQFSELVATAIAKAEARAELTASRARIVAASDDARRRIERDLHDGAQQRLVSLGLELRIAAEGMPIGLTGLDARLGHVADEIDGVIDDLREMSRGIHPAVLSDGGLGPAIEMLALRATVPVELDLGPPTRFAEQVEVAAYYVVSEALTNTAKHANASRARVLVEERNGRVCVSIDDDGDGGGEMDGGSGLTGLRDRVEALGGSFRLSSPPGEGTVVTVELPATRDGDPHATSRA